MHNESKYICRICGLVQEEPPWGDDGKTPSFNICLCCGVEFGYEDSSYKSIKNYREKWLLEGAKWFDYRQKPRNWILEKQLANIPEEYK